MTKDTFHNIKQEVALNPQTIATDTTTVGSIIDTQDWESLVVGLISGTVTDGDYTLLLEDGDDSALSDASVVADEFLLGTEAGASLTEDTDDGKMTKLGYLGCKRYVRVSVVSTNTSTGGIVGAYSILSHGRYVPDSTQKR